MISNKKIDEIKNKYKIWIYKMSIENKYNPKTNQTALRMLIQFSYKATPN